jgi:hypothetical protein
MVLCHGLDGLGNWLIEKKTECVEGARRDRTWSEYNCCHSSIAGQLDIRRFSSCLNTLQTAIVGTIWTYTKHARGQLVLNAIYQMCQESAGLEYYLTIVPGFSWSWMLVVLYRLYYLVSATGQMVLKWCQDSAGLERECQGSAGLEKYWLCRSGFAIYACRAWLNNWPRQVPILRKTN